MSSPSVSQVSPTTASAGTAAPVPTAASSLPAWVQQARAAAEQESRAQPWKQAYGETHNQGIEGEDLIDLAHPTQLQSLAA